MNYRSLSFAAGIVVLALSAGFIIHERGENKRLRAEVRDLRSENDRLSADLKAKMQSLLTEKSARNRSEMQARILSMKNDASSKQGARRLSLFLSFRVLRKKSIASSNRTPSMRRFGKSSKGDSY